jgi:hypothetical protein
MHNKQSPMYCKCCASVIVQNGEHRDLLRVACTEQTVVWLTQADINMVRHPALVLCLFIFIIFSLNALYQCTLLLNFCYLIFGLMPFVWLYYIVTPLLSDRNIVPINAFLIYAYFFKMQLGHKTRAVCNLFLLTNWINSVGISMMEFVEYAVTLSRSFFQSYRWLSLSELTRSVVISSGTTYSRTELLCILQ